MGGRRTRRLGQGTQGNRRRGSRRCTRSRRPSARRGGCASATCRTTTTWLTAVRSQVEHFRDRCEVLLVLGIGGSALGNIALQSALNSPTYNMLSDRTRSGPAIFVLDNVDPDHIKAVVEFVHAEDQEDDRQRHQQERRDGRERRRSSSYSATLFAAEARQALQGKRAGDDRSQGRHAAETGGRRKASARWKCRTGVGGRFSVLSAGGLFSAAMCGSTSRR